MASKTDEELLELAKKELLQDVRCAAVRAEQFGAHSWAKPTAYTPNKRFLKHMLVSMRRSNTRDTPDAAMTPRVTSAKRPRHQRSESRDRRRSPRLDSEPDAALRLLGIDSEQIGGKWVKNEEKVKKRRLSRWDSFDGENKDKNTQDCVIENNMVAEETNAPKAEERAYKKEKISEKENLQHSKKVLDSEDTDVLKDKVSKRDRGTEQEKKVKRERSEDEEKCLERKHDSRKETNSNKEKSFERKRNIKGERQVKREVRSDSETRGLDKKFKEEKKSLREESFDKERNIKEEKQIKQEANSDSEKTDIDKKSKREKKSSSIVKERNAKKEKRVKQEADSDSEMRDEKSKGEFDRKIENNSVMVKNYRKEKHSRESPDFDNYSSIRKKDNEIFSKYPQLEKYHNDYHRYSQNSNSKYQSHDIYHRNSNYDYYRHSNSNFHSTYANGEYEIRNHKTSERKSHSYDAKFKKSPEKEYNKSKYFQCDDSRKTSDNKVVWSEKKLKSNIVGSHSPDNFDKNSETESNRSKKKHKKLKKGHKKRKSAQRDSSREKSEDRNDREIADSKFDQDMPKKSKKHPKRRHISSEEDISSFVKEKVSDKTQTPQNHDSIETFSEDSSNFENPVSQNAKNKKKKHKNK